MIVRKKITALKILFGAVIALVLLVLEDKTIPTSCVDSNLFSLHCIFENYGLEIKVFFFVLCIQLGSRVFFGKSIQSVDTLAAIDTVQIHKEWKRTDKRRFAILLILGALFVYFIFTTAFKWEAAQEARFSDFDHTEEIDLPMQ